MVCLTDFTPGHALTVLPCEHRFCPDCIARWLELSPLCPCCKQDSQVHGESILRRGVWTRLRGVVKLDGAPPGYGAGGSGNAGPGESKT